MGSMVMGINHLRLLSLLQAFPPLGTDERKVPYQVALLAALTNASAFLQLRTELDLKLVLVLREVCMLQIIYIYIYILYICYIYISPGLSVKLFCAHDMNPYLYPNPNLIP